MRATTADPRSRIRSHELITDSALAVALTVASLLFILLVDAETAARWQGVTSVEMRAPDALSLALAALCALPVALRRRCPLVVLAVTTLPDLALHALDYSPGLSGVAALVLLYSVAAHRGHALSLLALAVTGLGYAVGALLSAQPLSWTDHVIAVVLSMLCWTGGRGVRLRRAYLAELVDRTDRLERAREADTRAARAEERSRIARELHDVVAHHVSVMTVQAAAARKMLAVKPDVARDALTAIEEMGRTAMAEMRNIVGVLRTDGPAELGPQPGVQDVPVLVDQMREAGLRTQLSVEDGDGAERALPPGVDLAAYRLIQEALTNSLRHAGPAARAWVTVRREGGELLVHVEDDGRGPAAETRQPNRTGHGLVGIKERVALYGGVLRIGPRDGGGFEVSARFPLKDR
ncbi:sensor histidine kinase [Microtetraspora sp. NBRC 16547]|uniref:sensor histidine kinase n=1 Tax=Microtetraspora sp. NBRC 16547 TaxID=3030993 RepID=UPI0024A44C66|nr:sensor histidine kinase [Microtetraspora sp. NBRC 16547]GLW99693.1 two-component sensor histidine kinase [Microtetraspora sp. NBRC 16547]